MEILHQILFKLTYLLKSRGKLIYLYRKILKNRGVSYKILQELQEKQLCKMLSYIYKNIPYYQNTFKSNNILPDSIKKLKDLKKLPIINKIIIMENYNKFLPCNPDRLEKHKESTGGTTNCPFIYHISEEDFRRSAIIRFKDWSYGGYRLGEKFGVVIGYELYNSKNLKFENIIPDVKNFILNQIIITSFSHDENVIENYLLRLNKFKPKFLRGYPSSLYFYAKFIYQNKIKLSFQPKAIFTYGEKLFTNFRKFIEEIFESEVFNNYGLTDGGGSACECEKHEWLHVDTERAILEVVNSKGEQIENEIGSIVITTLYNTVMPLIRYDTGDVGIFSSSKCTCGYRSPLLKVICRKNEIIETSDAPFLVPVLKRSKF